MLFLSSVIAKLIVHSSYFNNVVRARDAPRQNIRNKKIATPIYTPCMKTSEITIKTKMCVLYAKMYLNETGCSRDLSVEVFLSLLLLDFKGKA